MAHTSGLCSDDDNSPGNEGLMQSQTEQPNWWKYTLDLPMESDPGTRYAYCSGGMNLVGAALTAGTRTWLPELFDRLIARPLQFGPYHWNLMPTDEGYLGGGVFLRSRDLLKVGQMYSNNGMWNGQQLLPVNWIKETVQSSNADKRKHYGYQFWLNGYDENDNTRRWYPDVPADMFFCDGYGGSMSISFPLRN